jgi:formylglycine-generating enzyme required for sulfatase activity
MGSNAGNSDEKPIHPVTIRKGYWIGKYEVTQKEYQSLVGSNPSTFKGVNRPVEQVSWDDAVSFCKKLTEQERVAGRLPSDYEYRLPTEAEWEYAARGGNVSKGYKYSGSDNPDKSAWHYSASGGTTHEVGTKSPNELGIYDMSGNVWEFCSDWYGEYSGYTLIDPTGTMSGSYRVLRGGGWDGNANNCRVAARSYNLPADKGSIIGFRVALAPILK